MKLDKATIISNRGYITPELVSEAIMSNREMISNDDNYFSNEYGRHLKEDAYIEYILPYESVVNLVNIIYADDLDWLSMDALRLSYIKDDKAIDSMTPDQVKDFDSDLKKFAVAMVMREEGLSPAEIERIWNLSDR